jgi:hypothetical protein
MVYVPVDQFSNRTLQTMDSAIKSRNDKKIGIIDQHPVSSISRHLLEMSQHLISLDSERFFTQHGVPVPKRSHQPVCFE